MSKGVNKQERKDKYWSRLISLLDEFSKILIVTADNVGSNQMQKIRKALRGEAVLLMGKNTMIRKAIRVHLEKNRQLEGLLPHIKGNIGFVFTNSDLAHIRNKITELKVEAAAKAGGVAPIDVTVPAGNTGMEPTKTSFFQALSIPTRISRGSIEIINDIHLLTAGVKVTLSQAALLQMLDIRPFHYGLKVVMVYDNGAVFPTSVLDLTDADILNKFFRGVNNVAALSLAVGHPTVVSLPHSLLRGYKNLIAVCLGTDYCFPRAEALKQLLSDPAAMAAAAARAAAPAPGSEPEKGGPAPEVKEVVPDKVEEEEAEDLPLDLFGGGSDDEDDEDDDEED